MKRDKDFDSFFQDKEPWHFVQTRTSDGLFKLIESEAKKNGQPVAEWLRDSIGLRLLGRVLKKSSRLTPEQKEVVEDYREKLKELTESLTRGAKHQQLLERVEQQAYKAIRPAIREIVEENFVQQIVEQIKQDLFGSEPRKKGTR